MLYLVPYKGYSSTELVLMELDYSFIKKRWTVPCDVSPQRAKSILIFCVEYVILVMCAMCLFDLHS